MDPGQGRGFGGIEGFGHQFVLLHASKVLLEGAAKFGALCDVELPTEELKVLWC